MEINKTLQPLSNEVVWISNIDPNNTHLHKIKNLNNEHLANIIYFMINDTNHGHSKNDIEVIVLTMLDEAARRELTREFLNKAPYSYDPNEPYIEYQP